MLKEIAPRVARVVFLFNPATATYAEYYLTPFKAAAASFGVRKFELVINLKTAKALGLDVSMQLKQRADEVVE